MKSGKEGIMSKERRNLTDEEKKFVREKYGNRCYICELPLDGYDNGEIQYDHIYAHATEIAGGEELDKFAPIHASSNPSKRNCHGGKGTKTWFEYKEEIRIKNKLSTISGLKDICKNAKLCSFQMINNCEIEFHGKHIPLYNQNLSGKANFYFFDEVDIEYLENDNLIQLRPLEDKILPLTFHLRSSVQLLPSLGRLDTKESKVKIFDGQHKAVAQIVGNNKKSIPCIIFIDPDISSLQATVFDAHSKFLQQRYKRSHIMDKIAEQYKAKVEQWKAIHGDIPFSEIDILKGEGKPKRRRFILASVLGELSSCSAFIDGKYNFEKDFVDTTKKKGARQNPMLWDNYERLIGLFVNLEPISETSDSPNNYRADEIENLKYLLGLVYWFAIKDKWNPDNPESEGHQLAVRYFYDKVFEVYCPILAKALRYSYEQKIDKALREDEGLCYRDQFSEDIKKRFARIFERLFNHGVWANPQYRETFRATTSGPIAELFLKEALDYIYLTKPE
jgi:hypothetical protein